MKTLDDGRLLLQQSVDAVAARGGALPEDAVRRIMGGMAEDFLACERSRTVAVRRYKNKIEMHTPNNLVRAQISYCSLDDGYSGRRFPHAFEINVIFDPAIPDHEREMLRLIVRDMKRHIPCEYVDYGKQKLLRAVGL